MEQLFKRSLKKIVTLKKSICVKNRMCILGAYIILSHRGGGGSEAQTYFSENYLEIYKHTSVRSPLPSLSSAWNISSALLTDSSLKYMYFLTTKMLQLAILHCHSVTWREYGKRFKTSSKWTLILCVTWNGNVVEKDHSVSWYAATTIPGEVILEDHDEYLDHLLELHRPRPVLVIQTELPPELLLRRTRGLGSNPKHQFRQIFQW